MLKVTVSSSRRTLTILPRFFGSSRALQSHKFLYREKLDITPEIQTGAPLAGRKWLAGALNSNCKFPKYLKSPTANIPPVYVAQTHQTDKQGSDDINQWAKVARSILDDSLPKYGVVLFQNLPIAGAQELTLFLKGLGYSHVGYEGGMAVRTALSDIVMTASDDLPEVTIQPHNEMTYVENYPAKVFFYCDISAKPGCGGETGITRNKDVLAKLDPGVVEKFRKLGVMYHRYLPSKEHPSAIYTNWQKVFWTESKHDVAKYMKRFNYKYGWDEEDALSFSYVLPALRTHPKTGETIWYNHAHAHHASRLKEHPDYVDRQDVPDMKVVYHTSYGDGSAIELEVIQHIRDVLWQETVGFQMQAGDIVVFDNLTTMHTRLGFSGERKILASFSKD
ncbi:uncharacterized protein LOC144440357 [Glandiceps talaboti]